MRLLLLVAVLLAAVGCAPFAPPPPGPPPRTVAVYSDAGAWGPSTRSLVRILEEAGIATEELLAVDFRPGELGKYDALVFPGGNAWDQRQALGEPGVAAVRDFVARGGTYLGVCAGAFLATEKVGWEGAPPLDYPLALVPGVATGARDDIAPWPRVGATRLVLTGAGRARGLAWEDRETFFYQGGPGFSGYGDADVLATYPDGTPAILRRPYEAGQVILNAVHFERPVGASNEAPPPPGARDRILALLRR